MGLFQESTYYIGFLIASMFLIVGELKTSFSKELLVVSVSLFVIFSGSGNIVVYLISIFSYMVLSYRARGRKLIVRANTASAINHLFIYTAVLTLLLIINGLDPIVNGFRFSLQGASLSDSVQRWDNIKHSLSLIPEIPPGVGWNMLRSYNAVYHANTVASLGVNSAGSSGFLLQLLLEIGLFGTLCYIMSILTCCKTLVRKTAKSNTIGVAVSLLVILLLQVLNRVNFFPYFILIIGLAICGAKKTGEQSGV